MIKQNNFSIHADTIQVTTLFNGTISRIFGAGLPILFQQHLANGEDIRTESDEIDYVTSSWTLVFRGNVKLQRGNWHLESEIVEYNIRNGNFRAQSADQSFPGERSSQSQVRFTYGE